MKKRVPIEEWYFGGAMTGALTTNIAHDYLGHKYEPVWVLGGAALGLAIGVFRHLKRRPKSS